MNPRDRHSPIPPATARVRCPVCHESVYSRAGIHPQCAVVRADRVPPRPKVTPPKVKHAVQWTKSCPQCKRQLHVRRVMCDCGYTFQPKPAAG